MKFLLFTLLCSFTGVLFANSHIASDSSVVASLDASFTCDALLLKGDKSELDDFNALIGESPNGFTAGFRLVKYPALSVKAYGQFDYHYHTRAPPRFI